MLQRGVGIGRFDAKSFKPKTAKSLTPKPQSLKDLGSENPKILKFEDTLP